MIARWFLRNLLLFLEFSEGPVRRGLLSYISDEREGTVFILGGQYLLSLTLLGSNLTLLVCLRGVPPNPNALFPWLMK